MKSVYKSLVFLLILSFLTGTYAFGQRKLRARNKFEYEKLYDGSKILRARIFIKTSLGLIGVKGANISFAAKAEETKADLGTVTTNENGEGYLIIDKGYELPHSDGKTTYELTFHGNDSINHLSDDMNINDVDLAMKMEEDGDDKRVALLVTDFQGQPVERTKVKLFVKRMFSSLPLGDARTDSLGKVTFAVPSDIPGDAKGNITLLGLIERDRKFGNVEIRQDVNWGLPNTYAVSNERKTLWTQSAPTWMQVAVFGVFFVVAVFFLYALNQVFMIPKSH